MGSVVVKIMEMDPNRWGQGHISDVGAPTEGHVVGTVKLVATLR